jgi:hypothetical protein
MTQAKRVLSTPRRTASKNRVKKIAKPASAESQEDRNLRHGEDFRELETPIRDLGAMVDVVMMIWRHPELGNGRHADRMHVALDKLELMTESMVDDYTAKLEQKAVAS